MRWALSGGDLVSARNAGPWSNNSVRRSDSHAASLRGPRGPRGPGKGDQKPCVLLHLININTYVDFKSACSISWIVLYVFELLPYQRRWCKRKKGEFCNSPIVS